MEAGIDLNSPSLATYYLRMISYGSNAILSTGTGFIYEYKEEIFLITNGHNLTRMNPELNKRICSSAGFPVKINTKLRGEHEDSPNELIVDQEFFTIHLYEDDEYKKPVWYVHPDKGYNIDVVAIPFGKVEDVPSNVKLFPINHFDFNKDYYPIVSDDVFILGYPFDISTKELPIWKRGTIATEPFLDIDGLPKMYVDTATRSGMSGSPVIMQRSGIHGLNNGVVSGKEIIGRIRNFIGIYSGRIGAEDESKVQLGIIWKEKVIREILDAKQIGTIDFQKL